jgi:hypothetical protein
MQDKPWGVFRAMTRVGFAVFENHGVQLPESA